MIWQCFVWKRRVKGGILGVIGFLLSPLSWWNDAFVNLPLALGFGWLVGLIYRPAFEWAVIVGYWLTNVLGLLLLHKGVKSALKPQERSRYTKRQFFFDIGTSAVYTAVILLLIKLRIFQPLTSYFGTP